MTINNKESCLSMDSEVIINLSPLKRNVNSLNEMEQISDLIVIYWSVLAIKYGYFIA